MAKNNKRNKKRFDKTDYSKEGGPCNYGEKGRSHAHNAFEWYNKYPELTEAAGRIPFTYFPGHSVKGLAKIGSTDPQFASSGRADYPGIFTLDWIPSVGRANTYTDPINLAAKEIYEKVRRAFSGNLNADSPDFIIFMMALDSIFGFIAYLKRIYRISYAYTKKNNYLPRKLLTAMGLTDSQVNQIQSNLPSFNSRINQLILSTSRLECPAIMDIMNRHYWMNDNVYGDRATVEAQIYLFNQRAFYIMDHDDEGIGMLSEYVLDFANGDATADICDYLYSFGKNMIDALSDDVHTWDISGYLMRAFEGVNSFKVDLLPADASLNIVYDLEVLQQIHNALCITHTDRFAYNWRGMAIKQNVPINCVVHNPQLGSKDYFALPLSSDLLLDMWSENNVSVRDAFESTRLRYTFTLNTTDGPSNDINYWWDVNGGTELVVGAYVTVMSDSGATTWDYNFRTFQSELMNVGNVVEGTGVSPSSEALDAYLATVYARAWAGWPVYYVITRNYVASGEYQYTLTPGADFNCTAVLPGELLDEITRVAVLSEFNAYSI